MHSIARVPRVTTLRCNNSISLLCFVGLLLSVLKPTSHFLAQATTRRAPGRVIQQRLRHFSSKHSLRFQRLANGYRNHLEPWTATVFAAAKVDDDDDDASGSSKEEQQEEESGGVTKAKKKKKDITSQTLGPPETYETHGYDNQQFPPFEHINDTETPENWDENWGQDGILGSFHRPEKMEPSMFPRQAPWREETEEEKQRRMEWEADLRNRPWLKEPIDWDTNELKQYNTDDGKEIDNFIDYDVRYGGMTYPEYLKKRSEMREKEIEERDQEIGPQISELQPPIVTIDFSDPTTMKDGGGDQMLVPEAMINGEFLEITKENERVDIGFIPLSPAGITVEIVAQLDADYFKYEAADIWDKNGHLREGKSLPEIIYSGSSATATTSSSSSNSSAPSSSSSKFQMMFAINGIGGSSLDFVGFDMRSGKWVLGNASSIALSNNWQESRQIWRHITFVKSHTETSLYVDGIRVISKSDMSHRNGFSGGRLLIGSVANNIEAAKARFRFASVFNGSFTSNVAHDLFSKRTPSLQLLPSSPTTGMMEGLIGEFSKITPRMLFGDYYIRMWQPTDRLKVVDLIKKVNEESGVENNPDLDRCWSEPEMFFEEADGELWVVEESPGGDIIAVCGWVPAYLYRGVGSVDIHEVFVHPDYQWKEGGGDNNHDQEKEAAYLEHQLLQFIESRCFEQDYQSLYLQTSSLRGAKWMDLLWTLDYRQVPEQPRNENGYYYDPDVDNGAPYPNTMIYTEPRADLFLRKNVPFLMDLDLLDSIQNNEDFQDRFEAEYAKEGEVWEAVDNYGHRIMGVPNEWAMLNRWMVRGVGIILLNYEQDKVFVHKRSQSKKNFPGMYDMFIGGHSNDKEHDLETIYRELNEEIGLDEPLHLCDAEYQCVVKTSTNNVFVGLYRAVAPPNFEPEFRDGEIAWGDWMSRDEIEAKLESQEWDWVPDGLQVWDAMKEYERFERRAMF